VDNKKVIEFYNDYVGQQQDTGINERIFELFRRLKKHGLKSDSKVLELGCGIGTLTYLLSKKVTSGEIESVDISTESVAFAKKKLERSNLHFHAHDVVNYSPKLKQPDFITLFDVIEHIPIEKHTQLFANLNEISGENTLILINIPSPEAIQFDIDNNPDVLQVVDQPLPTDFIVKNIVSNGLQLVSFENHSIWAEYDYQFFVIRKARKYEEVKLSKKRSVFQKSLNKIQREWRKIVYSYK
jgi:trans-aconitate 2-methyltransferase